jgi:prolyl-tRNA editing enzyme YbaK/EbsC (Cys-tRNA(Pro) deacylase)
MSAVLESVAVQRVRRALASAGLASDVVELPGAARTAKAAAEFLRCDVAQIANSLVFRGASSSAAILVMSSGARRVDLQKLAQVVGEPILKADAEFVRAATGFAIGGVAPVGHTGEVRAFVERSLAAHDRLWAAAGHPNTVFALTYEALRGLVGGREIDVAASP